jgi:RND family efflux transporter MFP subunit
MFNQTAHSNKVAVSPTKRSIVMVSLLLGVAGAGLAVAGITQRQASLEELKAVSAQSAIPTVSVVKPAAAVTSASLVLPGQLEPLNSAAIYAQTQGYIQQWLVDIGDKVEKDQLLAVLDAPQLDHQLAQAKADYQTALAEQHNAQSMAGRATKLVQLNTGAIAAETAEQRQREAEAKTALSAAALANVKRLEALKGFTRLTAPFAGVVTSRSVQLGDLVGTGGTGAGPLFTIADTSQMRVFVRVPQHEAPQMESGLLADLVLPEYDNKTFAARVSRSAGAVDPVSGAVLVELLADNTEGALLPGAYAQVRFNVKNQTGRLNVPGSALLYRDQAPAVATVDPASDTVRLKTVRIGRDSGAQVEIISGLNPEDLVISTPPDAVRTGDQVRVVSTGP